MFRLHKLQLILYPFIKNKNLIRQYRVKKVIDPGITHRKTFLEEHDIEDFDEAHLEQLESDFMNVHMSYADHLKNVDAEKERLKLRIIKRKYFKERHPNFLTWNEKEQIRYLHSTNPEEWSIETLSDSFPALPQTIEKVIRAKYSKAAPKIAKHDKVVQENWESFKKGEMDLSQQVAAHLKKFIGRSKTFVPLELPKKNEIINTPKVPVAFSEIIQDYKRLKETHKENSEEGIQEINVKLPQLGTTKSPIVNSKPYRSVTLQNLKDNILNKAERGSNLTDDDKILIKSENSFKDHSKLVVLNNETILNTTEKKYKTDRKLVKRHEDHSPVVFPQRIRIPKHMLNKNYTYKLNDCYYDYDGQFLYKLVGID